MVDVCSSAYMCENEVFTCKYGLTVCIFQSVWLELYHTLSVSEALDLILSFVLMLILISSYLNCADWLETWLMCVLHV